MDWQRNYERLANERGRNRVSRKWKRAKSESENVEMGVDGGNYVRRKEYVKGRREAEEVTGK